MDLDLGLPTPMSFRMGARPMVSRVDNRSTNRSVPPHGLEINRNEPGE